ncbi:MAG TPA: GIY-YIG nuclease family protein [Acetobacteraceae bacterium]|nr:GIY-YIG nuclease family protein [Acetobacteraceae bacterium]
MESRNTSKSVELLFVDGRPDGILTAEVSNWTGHLLMAPRTQIGEALARKEAGYTGVYLLVGEKDGNPLTYIGQAEAAGDLIRYHDTKREWWNSIVLVTSAANNLNTAQVRYLEARLIGLDRTIDRTSLENQTTPPIPRLTEAAQANMETFLENILMVLPALRIDSFLENTRPEPPQDTPLFELQLQKYKIQALARLVKGEFVVQSGSLARKAWGSKARVNTTYRDLYDQLVSERILHEQGEHRVFTANCVFKSPTAAASIVKGYTSTNDRKLQGSEKTYRQWEAEGLAGVDTALPRPTP